MKTSQYILISFFGFLIVAVFVLYVDSLGAHKVKQAATAEYTKTNPPKELKPFSTIVAGSDSNIEIIQDSTYSLGIGFTMDGTIPKLPEYKIMNDTLFISEGVFQTQAVIRSKSFHSIIGQSHSNIILSNVSTDSLSIYLDESSLSGSLSRSDINSLKLHVINGSRFSLQLNQSKIDVGLVEGSDSQIHLYGGHNFRLLDVALENSSQLSLSGKREKLIINSDASSRYNISNH